MSHTNSTPNYALPEFLSSDKPAWMADINVAFSDIDTAMKNNADSAAQANTDIGTIGLNFAPGYSNASTYDVGDVVVYNKRMWICDIAVTVPEAFDSGKWSYYRVSDTADAVANVSAAENALEGVVGSDDISAVGTSCTDAILNLNANLSDIDTEIHKTVGGTFITVANAPVTATADGYVEVTGDSVYVQGSSGNRVVMTAPSGSYASAFVRKGMQMQRVSTTGTARFMPLE